MSEDGNRCTIYSLRSQLLYSNRSRKVRQASMETSPPAGVLSCAVAIQETIGQSGRTFFQRSVAVAMRSPRVCASLSALGSSMVNT
jgi:hypothetical protein